MLHAKNMLGQLWCENKALVISRHFKNKAFSF